MNTVKYLSFVILMAHSFYGWAENTPIKPFVLPSKVIQPSQAIYLPFEKDNYTSSFGAVLETRAREVLAALQTVNIKDVIKVGDFGHYQIWTILCHEFRRKIVRNKDTGKLAEDWVLEGNVPYQAVFGKPIDSLFIRDIKFLTHNTNSILAGPQISFSLVYLGSDADLSQIDTLQAKKYKVMIGCRAVP